MITNANPLHSKTAERKLRRRITVSGTVQGVGLRPFAYRLAREMGLKGWVRNTPQGVTIEIEGNRMSADAYLLRFSSEKPEHAWIHSLETLDLDPCGYADFELRESGESGAKSPWVLPDIATCPDCLKEIFDPADRRYLYPFTNCTHCGPRYSILEDIPYDRAHTTMKNFQMCGACRREFEDPQDRRFHAQPNACPACGPHLETWDPRGGVLALGHEAMLMACDAIRAGKIVAVKGLGGFHLVADAAKDFAVDELRRRKNREEKPFALMFPTLTLAESAARISPAEARVLLSPESPIVLLRRKADGDIAACVAPENPYLGIFLPSTPLHHIMMKILGSPVVATSGNLSDETLCYDETEALERLAAIADLFLVHNRPIARHVDDSIVKMIKGREMVLRRARGFAPKVVCRAPSRSVVLSVGAHLKNTMAFSKEGEIVLSQHIGDLESPQTYAAFEKTVGDLSRLYDVRPEAVACDLHPDYLSTQYACRSGLPRYGVQHHLAHVLACMAENEIEDEVLGISWDGTGWGMDASVWGGEFLAVNKQGFERTGHFRTFSLPGADAAVKEPRRSALGLLYEIFGEQVFGRREIAAVRVFKAQELSVLQRMLRTGIRSPRTTSVGRLFDAVASLLDICQVIRFEGQAAMKLEFAALDHPLTGEKYDFDLHESDAGSGGFTADWEPMIRGMFQDLKSSLPCGMIAAKFHRTLSEIITCAARRAGKEKVVLTGGCFQNQCLTECAIDRLREEGFKVYWHQRVPPNDGGIALGQIVFALRALKASEP